MNGDDMISEGGPDALREEYEVWVVTNSNGDPILSKIYGRKSSAKSSASGHNNANERSAEYYDSHPDLPNNTLHAADIRADFWYVTRGTLVIHDD